MKRRQSQRCVCADGCPSTTRTVEDASEASGDKRPVLFIYTNNYTHTRWRNRLPVAGIEQMQLVVAVEVHLTAIRDAAVTHEVWMGTIFFLTTGACPTAVRLSHDVPKHSRVEDGHVKLLMT